eukprot:2200567-Pyramimonas_sp.AAC.1
MGHDVAARKLRDRQKAKNDRADWEQRRGRHAGRAQSGAGVPDYVPDRREPETPRPVIPRGRSRSRD